MITLNINRFDHHGHLDGCIERRSNRRQNPQSADKLMAIERMQDTNKQQLVQYTRQETLGAPTMSGVISD